MILSTAFLIKWGGLVLNRITSWFGSSYFIKKGVKNKDVRWRYFALAVVISLIMLGLLLYMR